MFGRNKDRDAKSAPPERAPPPRPVTGGAAAGTVAGSAARTNPPRPPQGGRLAYEARRAEKAGMGLEKWMAEKSRRVQEQREATERVQRKAAAATARPGLLRRLLDRAHKPL